MLNPTIKAVVCIPTFRRPDWLRSTLASLDQQTANFGFAIVVVDNDAKAPVGAEAARTFLAQSGRPGLVAVEAEQGNCHAINRAFRTARENFPSAEYFAMIDDDETADPDWLKSIVETAERLQADIVGGPVDRTFEIEASEAIRQHPLFGSIPAATGPVDIIHGSGNCLIRRRVFEGLSSPDFDIRFNFLGGGDMDFFTRCRAAGFRFAWSAEARILEFVPSDRVSARWLMARSLRTGSINYTIDRLRAGSPFGVAKILAKNVASLGVSVLRSALMLARTRKLLPASHPLLMSIGRTLASLGFSPVPYKAPAPVSLSAAPSGR
jgi:GT2 family glycosyltransferase